MERKGGYYRHHNASGDKQSSESQAALACAQANRCFPGLELQLEISAFAMTERS